MPLSASSAGTPRSGRSQQLLPSAIMESILIRRGSESARPRATSRSRRSSESRSTAPEPAPLCSMTSISWLGNVRLLLDRLLGPHEGASGRHLPERLALLRGVEAVYGLGIVDVLNLHRDVLKARLLEQRLVLLLLQRPDHAPGPQPNGLEHLLDVALEEFCVFHPSLGLVLASKLEHLVCHVYPVGLSARRDPPSREQHVDPAAAPEVQDHLSR